MSEARQHSREGAISVNGVGGDRSSMLAVYAQVGENYRQIDDLRLRLLALLPLATGTELLVLLGGHSVSAAVDVPAGVFGMTATLSLYLYELHGVEKCAHYIYRGARLENDLGVPGSFTNRPHHIFGVVSELLPSALIYPGELRRLVVPGAVPGRPGCPQRSNCHRPRGRCCRIDEDD